MAIIVEEEKKRSNILGIVGWVVFVGLVLAVVYYVFFVSPPAETLPTTGNFSTIAPIVTANITPQTIIGSTQFQSLQSTITLPTPNAPVSVGRSNPFIAP